MSDVHRVEGIKYNFDRLTDAELENIYGHLVEKANVLLGEIALVDTVIVNRNNPQMELPYGDESQIQL